MDFDKIFQDREEMVVEKKVVVVKEINNKVVEIPQKKDHFLRQLTK